MQVKRLIKISVAAFCLMIAVVWAEETLSKEFLEYLAEFETDDGEWIDPEELAMMAAAGENTAETEEANQDD